MLGGGISGLDILPLADLEATPVETPIPRPRLDQPRLVVLGKRAQEFDVVRTREIQRAYEKEANVSPLHRLMQGKGGILSPSAVVRPLAHLFSSCRKRTLGRASGG